MKKLFLAIFLIAFPALLFLATLKGESGNPKAADFKNNLDQASKPFELSPERGRYAHVYSLAEQGKYDLDLEWAEAVYPDVGYREGKFYSFFAPGISYMAVPFYELGREHGMAQLFTFGFISICAVLALAFIYRISRDIIRLPVSLSLAAALAFGFSTTAWGYAGTLYQHHVFTLLLLSGFYAVWKYRQGNRTSWLWGTLVWLNYGLAILIDYPNAILMLPVMVYFLASSISVSESSDKYTVSLKWGILATFLVFVVVTGFHGYHNQKHFGSWKSLSGGIIGYKDIKEDGLLAEPDAQDRIAELQATKSVGNFFAEEKFARGFQILLASRDRGLFLYTPFLLLGFIGLFMSIRKARLEQGVLMALISVNLVLYSSWGDPWGGWAYGPRYLIPSMAILSIFAAVFIRDFKYQVLGRLIAYALLAYSSAVAVLGALTTNAVPPKVEADYLKTGYNFMYNWEVMKSGRSSSYIYNTFLNDKLTLYQYGILLLLAVLVVMIFTLFFIPTMEHDDED